MGQKTSLDLPWSSGVKVPYVNFFTNCQKVYHLRFSKTADNVIVDTTDIRKDVLTNVIHLIVKVDLTLKCPWWKEHFKH